jgi:hypothetical protein
MFLRQLLAMMTLLLAITIFSGCSRGIDGIVEVDVDGISVSNIRTEEATEMGTKILYVTATFNNETEDLIVLGGDFPSNIIETQFYDSNGNRIDGRSTRVRLQPGTQNDRLAYTERIDVIDSFEIKIYPK